MTYLFWAFAVVWIGLFIYVYGLVQRSRRLERELGELIERSRSGGTPPRAGASSHGTGLRG
ncbi:MAG TPA: CcmD family protein [bacterium]|nr:CcmD family protein [bacterium]